MAHNDADLLERAKRGDEAAFEELYDRYQPSVYTYIFYRTSSVEISEELTSEVFARLVSKVQSIMIDKAPLLAWLYTVARNLVIDSYRQQQRKQWVPLDEQWEAGETANPFLEADRKVTQATLTAALGCLTETQRQVVLLKFIEGYSNVEIGRLLGKDEGAVKSLQHRALGALRRALVEGGGL